MEKNTPDFSVETLSPYIRLTKKSNNFRLWVIVPMPVNYHLRQEENPQVEIISAKNTVKVTIFVDGPKKNVATPLYYVPIEVTLPSKTGMKIGIDDNTTIYVRVLLDDPEIEGVVKTKYGEAEEE